MLIDCWKTLLIYTAGQTVCVSLKVFQCLRSWNPQPPLPPPAHARESSVGVISKPFARSGGARARATARRGAAPLTSETVSGRLHRVRWARAPPFDEGGQHPRGVGMNRLVNPIGVLSRLSVSESKVPKSEARSPAISEEPARLVRG